MTKIMSDTTFFGILLGGILLSSGVLVGDAYGAVFAKYDGIDGESESSDGNHDKWIDVLSIDWGMHKDKAKKKKPAKNVIDNFQMTMEYEKSSPKLLEAALTGKVIPKLEIQLTKIGCIDPPRSDTCTSMEQVTYLKYELINVRVTSYDINVSGGADEITLPPTVVLSNNFEEIKVTYTEYDDEGKNKGNVETEHKIGKGEK